MSIGIRPGPTPRKVGQANHLEDDLKGEGVRRRAMYVAVLAAALATIGVGIASFAIAGSAKQIVTADTLSGYLEGTPGPVSSVASGTFSASIDESASDNGPAIHYTLTYANLESAVQQAHIHFGQRSVSGGISAFLCSNLGNGPVGTPACPPSPGSVSGIIRPAEVIGPAAQGIAPGEFVELVRAIRAGRAYANVHSATFPAGEIRAQINDQDQRDD